MSRSLIIWKSYCRIPKRPGHELDHLPFNVLQRASIVAGSLIQKRFLADEENVLDQRVLRFEAVRAAVARSDLNRQGKPTNHENHDIDAFMIQPVAKLGLDVSDDSLVFVDQLLRGLDRRFLGFRAEIHAPVLLMTAHLGHLL